MGKISVVGQEQQPARVLVETPDREKPQPPQLRRQQIQHRPLAPVLRGRDHAHRLIQHIIMETPVADPLPVQRDCGERGVELPLGMRLRRSVHADAAGADDLAKLLAGSDALVGQHLVQTHQRHGAPLPIP